MSSRVRAAGASASRENCAWMAASSITSRPVVAQTSQVLDHLRRTGSAPASSSLQTSLERLDILCDGLVQLGEFRPEHRRRVLRLERERTTELIVHLLELFGP